MNYNEINTHPRDAYIGFEPESHTYTLGNEVLRSVTNIVEDCFPKFDATYWAERKAPAAGLTPDELIARWEEEGREARRLGTVMHDRIERYYLGDDFGDDGEAYSMFRHFAAAQTLYPYRTEWRIYHEDFHVAGTLDFLERRPDGTYNIYDWKRSRKLVDCDGRIVNRSRFGKRGLGHAALLDDCSYNHYALQVSIYRIILESCYGININGMYLGVFHPENPSAYVIPLPFLESMALAILAENAAKCEKSLKLVHAQ